MTREQLCEFMADVLKNKLCQSGAICAIMRVCSNPLSKFPAGEDVTKRPALDFMLHLPLACPQ